MACAGARDSNASSKEILPPGSVMLTSAQMMAVERAAMARGVSGWRMMHRAGKAAAERIFALLEKQAAVAQHPPSALVVCGGGNNGGDGYVIATRLRRKGWRVRVLQAATVAGGGGARDSLSTGGGAANAMSAASVARRQWLAEANDDETICYRTGGDARDGAAQVASLLSATDVLVDALFGTGLSRELDAASQHLIEMINAARSRRVATVAIDLPSGGDADTGAVRPLCVLADNTITFGHKKRGHGLMPLAGACGGVEVVEIGTETADIVELANHERAPANLVEENTPAIWRDAVPQRRVSDHKYHHGYAVVTSGGGGLSLGAARLAVLAAHRAGCGLVALGASSDIASHFAASVEAEVLRVYQGDDDAAAGYLKPTETWGELIADAKVNALLIGPGGGSGDALRRRVQQALESGHAGLVLDADALSIWRGQSATFCAALRNNAEANGEGNQPVLTPHHGEFRRIFAHLNSELAATSSKIEAALCAARASKAVVVYKGADTVIAHPSGRVAIQCNAPAGLAVAGSGDVLSGIIVALRARGLPAFAAACASVWFHAEAARSLPARFTVQELIAALKVRLASP